MSRIGKWLSAILLLSLAAFGHEAAAQCMLANPSFEMTGGGGGLFSGWNQFGVFGITGHAPHGRRAAMLYGPNTPALVSGFWQPLDTTPGERWRATVCVWHEPAAPLTGLSKAIVNIEWLDAADALISFESHTAADASTPAGEFRIFSVESGPAPAGAVKTRLLLGVLQASGDPVPVVYYDMATFTSLTYPTVDDLQWLDFPGARTVAFGGRLWRVKGPGYFGPGPNLFCNTSDCVWVDASDRLHMTILDRGGAWYSTEAVLEEPLGYGDYVFTVLGPLDQWDPSVVLGLFLWEYGPAGCYDPLYSWWNPYNEIDVEISRWGDPANAPGQFVAQPWNYEGNLVRFDGTVGNPDRTSHAFLWRPDRVEFRSWRGGPDDESPANTIRAWTYTGPHIPRPDQPRVHINLWQFQSPPEADQEAIIESFTFTPECVGPLCGPLAVGPGPVSEGRLSAAAPNPFTDRTTIRYTPTREAPVDIAVYDVAGRLVRTIEHRVVPAGDHQAVWDGRDASGTRVVSGIYLYRIRVGDRTETRRVVVLK